MDREEVLEFTITLVGIIESGEHDELLMLIKEAIEYRSQYPWLGESGQMPGRFNRDGVAYALREALYAYMPNVVLEQRANTFVGVKVERQWKDRLLLAIDLVVNENVRLEWFLRKVDKSQSLSTQIVKALEYYCQRYKVGVTSDPW